VTPTATTQPMLMPRARSTDSTDATQLTQLN
jgi:hypothetical protein